MDFGSYKIDRAYQVIKPLGGGLSGDVLLVSDREGQKALKFLKKVQLNVSRQEALANFKNEFEILKKLAHPNIARILDFGFDEKLGKYYFTSEFVTGGTLDKACEGRAIEIIEILVVQILRALSYLHSRGVFHFDIKPQNILVETEGNAPRTAKLIDFGLAGYSSPGRRVGTPSYMAPEMIQGAVLDGRTDLYSLGLVVYKLFTGTNPMTTPDVKDTLAKQLSCVPEPPSSLNPKVPEFWDHIVKRLVEKDPAKRYSQASLAIRDLNYLSNRHIEVETRDTKLSYLPEKGILIGRDDAWEKFTDVFALSFTSTAPAGCRILAVEGGKGTGKTRFLSEIRYFSQLHDVPVLGIGRVCEGGERPERFIVLADENEAGPDDIAILQQELSRSRCLIVWATVRASADWSDCTVVSLKPYSRAELARYIEAVTGLDNAPEKLVEDIYARTQGNPLFVTGILKALLDQDMLCDASGKWDARTFDDIEIAYEKLDIPVSLEDQFLRQYQSLSSEDAVILASLACHGSELGREELDRLAGPEGAEGALNELEGKGIVVRTTGGYGFVNPLFAEVILKALPEDDLRLRHDGLASLYAGAEDKLPLYLKHAGHGTDLNRAVEALSKLAELKTKEMDFAGTTSALEELCRLTRGQPGPAWRTQALQLAEAYLEGRRNEEALRLLEELGAGFEGDDDGKAREGHLRIRAKLVLVYFRLNLLDKAEGVIKACLDNARDSTTDSLVFRNFLASLKYNKGEVDEAERIFTETEAAWLERLSDNERLKVTNNRLFEVQNLKKRYGRVIETCGRRIAILDRLPGALPWLANLHYIVGVACYRLTAEGEDGVRSDRSSLCLESLRKCETIARRTRNHLLLFSTLNELGNLHYEKGDVSEALIHYQRALAIARKEGLSQHAATISVNIGNCFKLLGQWDDAYSFLVYALNTFGNIPDKPAYCWVEVAKCRKILAEIYLERREYARAFEALDKGEAIIAERPFLAPYRFGLVFTRLKARSAQGDSEGFARDLAEARKLAKAVNEREELDAYLSSIGQSPPGDPPTVQIQNKGGKAMNHASESAVGADDLHKIIEINNFINRERDVKQLLKIVLNYALQLTRAELGFVILLEEDGTLTTAQAINATREDEEKVSMSIVKRTMETGEFVSSADAVSDERFEASESIVLNELKSVLCLPIKSRGRCVGVFYLDNRFQTNVFENCNVALLTAFCDQVGIAIENAKLFDKLMRAQDQLTEKLHQTEEELAEVKTLLVEESGVFKTKYAYNNIISKSKEMQSIFKLLDKVTETNLAVFLHGESGTGKELVAKALHYNNPVRGNKKFVAINCGAIPSNLMESELFGHKTGSFTGAIRDKKGMFEEANAGTLFLDEIGELPMELQVKLLRVLQEGEVQRIGENHAVKVDVRVISASLKDIETGVKTGKFREDLYYRLCQMRINLPPLRERKDDVPLLAKHFVKKYCQQNKFEETIHIPPEFMRALLEYDWPGNIRELENMILVACALQEKNELRLDGLPDHYGIKHMGRRHSASGETGDGARGIATERLSDVLIDEKNFYDPSKTWRDYEALIMAKCFEANERRKKPVADQLDLSHSTVYKKLEELGLEDANHAVYKESFIYDPRHTMRDYVRLVFSAALRHHGNHPYAAIRQLGVSQGYFYKIMKQIRGEESGRSESAAVADGGTMTPPGV